MHPLQLTKIAALEKSLIDWNHISICPGAEKMDLALSTYDYHKIPVHFCFCCEYAMSKLEDPVVACSLCPLNGFAWKADEDDPNWTQGFYCEYDLDSPYASWANCGGGTKAALRMVDAIEEALAYEYLREMNR